MPRISTSRTESAAALKALRASLTQVMGRPRNVEWSFPGGGRAEIKTWFHPAIASHPLAIAIGSNKSWGTRTPVLAARSEIRSGMTPAVEVNVPDTDGTVNRAVAGCFYSTPKGGVVLAHRGTSFTASGAKIPKEAIHTRFAKWLIAVEDDGRETEVIPIAPVGPDVAVQLGRFVDEVTALKTSWKAQRGSAGSTRSQWREDIRFPPAISRVVESSSKSFEYRHGPLQASLQAALRACLPTRLKTTLNREIDLAVLDGESVVAIFEVKTDLGPQLYAGIGQLFWYREIFAAATTPLFFVLPEGVRNATDVAEVGSRLEHVGITLLAERKGMFERWDRRPLARTLADRGVAVR